MPTTITLKKDKDCKHSVRFAATTPDAIVGSIYIAKPTSAAWTEVTITVEGK